ncbi:hypothetical protein QEP73_04130 [Pseudomonas defluvii]|nr:hypothetical protein QEP73_04130 [Pseudomonas defluvii]
MMKNVLAAVGLLVVVKAGFDTYVKYRQMERENEALRKAAMGE